MADRFRLTVLTPERRVFEGTAEVVEASGEQGSFGVLPGHYAYVTSIRPGGLVIGSGKDRRVFAVGRGLAQVAADKVSIVVASCEDAAGIDVEAARRALAQAEAQMVGLDPGDPAWADARIERELALGRIVAAGRLGG